MRKDGKHTRNTDPAEDSRLVRLLEDWSEAEIRDNYTALS